MVGAIPAKIGWVVFTPTPSQFVTETAQDSQDNLVRGLANDFCYICPFGGDYLHVFILLILAKKFFLKMSLIFFSQLLTRKNGLDVVGARGPLEPVGRE